MEILTKSGLALLAPEKNHEDMKVLMATVQEQIMALKDNRKKIQTYQNTLLLDNLLNLS